MASTINTWYLSGSIKGFGIKGDKYPKLWISVEVAIPNKEPCSIFVNVDISNDSSSKLGKQSKFLTDSLSKDKYISIHEAMVAPIQASKKDEAGEWQKFERTSIKAKLYNVFVHDTPPPALNLGIIRGKVVQQKDQKAIIEDRYLVPTDKTWKSRLVPVLLREDMCYKPLTNKNVLIVANIASLTIENDTKLFGIANKLIVLE